jgi:hypothetical protein
MTAGNVGSRRNQRRIQSWRGERSIAGDRRGGRNDRIHFDAIAGVVANHIRRGSHHVGGEIGSAAGGTQSFRGWGPWIWANCEEVGYSIARGRQFHIRGIYDLGHKRCAARNFDGLGAMIGFVSSGAACVSCLSTSQIFSARKFIAAIVDHVVAR